MAGSLRRGAWALAAALAAGLAWQTAVAAPAGDVETGRAIYLDGVLPQGAALQAEGAGGVQWQGADAACVRCHRRSGLGSYEGPTLVPPVIGPYLFRTGEDVLADLDLPHVAGYSPPGEAYTEATLLEALRTGHARGGRRLDPLMPRYALDAAQVHALSAYLRELGARRSPGVTADQVELAVVFTPQSLPAEAAALRAVVQAYADERNGRMAARAMASARGQAGQYRVARRWHVAEWKLQGDPAGWAAQLDALQASQPAFALLSGLGPDWRPIDAFCTRSGVPCLFPVTDLPGEGPSSVHFDGGVRLEAAVFANAIQDRDHAPSGRIVQVYRQGDVGEQASAALTALLPGREFVPVAWPADTAPSDALRDASVGATPGDIVVLWLRPPDLALLPLPRARSAFASGVMGGLESTPLGEGWRSLTEVSSPVDPPQRRFVRMNFPLAWLRRHGLAVLPGLAQAKAWLACELLEEAQGTLLDAYQQDFLLERLRAMVAQRSSTGPYPRLGLGDGQVMASKGAYLLRLEGPPGAAPRVDGDWIIP